MNNLTLVVDANWLLNSRFSVLSDKFNKLLPKEDKISGQQQLEELLSKSINIILNRFNIIDNIIFVADGGSWRKAIPSPDEEEIFYKGNRKQNEEHDWNYIYNALNNVLQKAKDQGITVSQYNQIEGDDWIWYWSKRLNSEGVNCLIWSSDNDLKQLIQIDHNTNAFTAWYNDKNGLWLHEESNDEFTDVGFFLKPHYYSQTMEIIKKQSKSINYINPHHIIMEKIICGDAGDNIKSVFRYTKNNRNYRITEKDWDALRLSKGINNMCDFLESSQYIISKIVEHKKYKDYQPSKDKILNMLNHNTKMVWLDDQVIPDTIIQFMNQQDYKLYDVDYMRRNYKVLLDQNNDIQNLFDSI